MPRKRLIFTLHYAGGDFMLSRNFRLQRVGDIRWLLNSYDFRKIAFSIDELVLLNVVRGEKDFSRFGESIKSIVDTCFIPVAAGGGVNSEAEAAMLMASGADKIVLNSLLTRDRDMTVKLIKIYGGQCIMASVDFRILDGEPVAFADNGARRIEIPLTEYLHRLVDLGVGEIYINAIDQEGTGTGYCIEPIREVISGLGIPVILSGGAGKYEHFIDCMKRLDIDAVATANLFNFIGEGFPNARTRMLEAGVDLARWDRGEEARLENHFVRSGFPPPTGSPPT